LLFIVLFLGYFVFLHLKPVKQALVIAKTGTFTRYTVQTRLRVVWLTKPPAYYQCGSTPGKHQQKRKTINY